MILYILDTKYFKRQSVAYLGFTIFCCVFGIIYEHFSHDVYSLYMLYAFLIPLFLGLIISVILCIINENYLPTRIPVNLYNASICTLTVYSIFKGVLEIYGTTNSLIQIYLYVGVLLLIVSLIIYAINLNYKYSGVKR